MKAICCIVGCLAVAVGWAQPQYEVVDLTKQFGEEFSARDINNAGVVVGSMRLTFSQSQACVIENGKLTMLPMYQGKHSWTALGINDQGDVLGAGTLGTGTYHSILYRGGKVIDIGIPGEPEVSGALAINNLGQVTGGMNGTPFVWENGVITPVKGAGAAVAINDSTDLAGVSIVGNAHASLWANGVYSDLHPSWAWQSRAASINNLGEVVGETWANAGGQHGVLWRNGKAIQLPNFGGGQSRAYDVNDLSQVVGWGSTGIGSLEAFLWQDGTLHALTDLMPFGHGYDLGWGQNINNASQVVALATVGTTTHWLVLNPVPEPSSFAVVVFGLISLTISFRLTRKG